MKQLTAAILVLTALATLTGCYPKTCPCTGGSCAATAPAK